MSVELQCQVAGAIQRTVHDRWGEAATAVKQGDNFAAIIKNDFTRDCGTIEND